MCFRLLAFGTLTLIYHVVVSAQSSILSLVDTRVGTATSNTLTAGMFGKGSEEKGQTLPAVLVPHGMNFWTPQTQDTEVKCRAPYYYHDNLLQGFRASHWIVGGCTQDYGSVTLMPMTMGCAAGTSSKDVPNTAFATHLNLMPEWRASHFCHENETATPSYYATALLDYDIQCEMTGLSHSAIFHFQYPSDSTACLVVNPNSDEGEGFIEILPENHQIRGYNPAHRIYQGKGEACGFNGWFIVELPKDVEITSYGTYHADTLFTNQKSIYGKPLIGAYVKLHTRDLHVKVSTSFVDWNGCKKNMQKEIPHWDFELARRDCEREWTKLFRKIEIKKETTKTCISDTMDILKLFYTQLYHTAFLPREFSDVDGRYPSFGGGQKIMHMPKGHIYYDDFSMWDTYRALHPLLVLIEPDRVSDMMQSLVLKYEQGGWLPIFPCWNSYTAAMIGDHCSSALTDAYIKGIHGFDASKAYEAMRKNAFETPSTYEEYNSGMGRRALSSYLHYGYIPLEDSVKEAYHKGEQVSRTMEYSYDDFCVAQMAKALGKTTDYRTLMRRSKNYRHVIDPRTGYAQGKWANGQFINETNHTTFQKFITEGAPCHYTWYVPHDVKGLIKAMGGKKAFETRLDSIFSEKRYWHGNEPCHQIAYLYNYINKPHKTQRYVKHIRSTEYNSSPGGLSGNDDAGQMSAWYIFSAIGFYPVCPGLSEYAIGTPLFPEVTLHLPNGKDFTIKAMNLSEHKPYIQSMRLNGKTIKKPFITHNDIIQGGTLELEMTQK